ncbi:hypothetical protein H3N56_10340 [Cetobacterium sp. 2A]|uniref:hypothetical protein n=1 Tax=Cetobacterium sp. 2A TaxID=2754723 RepID=UPI00163B8F7B|nr:hypothetical protein [Cetobacterium sp. 2A]MBC2856798.1 hypothetical protein [Cetobacterium sp. 2A]MBC2856839.1 hypothetical protein [Cetobacterium sp. 2A]
MKNSVLGKIKNQISSVKTEERQLQEYLSTFDFESFEINENDKNFITERENVFIKNGKIYSDSLYKMCLTLLEIKERLTNSEIGFMAWYTHIGLNKDKVSELLKRAYLYKHFNSHKPFISSLSGYAVRVITAKEVTFDEQLEIIENKITAVKEIKETINNNESIGEIVTSNKTFKYFNIKSVEKIHKDVEKMDLKEVFNAKKEIEIYKKLLKEAEKKLEEKEKEYENKDNLKLLEAD